MFCVIWRQSERRIVEHWQLLQFGNQKIGFWTVHCKQKAKNQIIHQQNLPEYYYSLYVCIYHALTTTNIVLTMSFLWCKDKRNLHLEFAMVLNSSPQLSLGLKVQRKIMHFVSLWTKPTNVKSWNLTSTMAFHTNSSTTVQYKYFGLIVQVKLVGVYALSTSL